MRAAMNSVIISILIVAVFQEPALTFDRAQRRVQEDPCETVRCAEAELDRIYSQILERYRDDTLFIAKLEVAEKAWRTFRDAHLESLFPAEPKPEVYGSAYRYCHCRVLAAMTRARITQLIRWVQGVEEGEVCSGSMKTREALKRLQQPPDLSTSRPLHPHSFEGDP